MEVLHGLKNFSLFRLVLCWLLFVPFIACEDEPEKRTDHAPAPKEEEKYVAVAPELNEDSVYSFIQQQVAFGPRVPSTKAHKQCATYLTEKLRAYGFSVSTQTTTVQTFDGKKHGLVNIIGSYKKAGSPAFIFSLG